MPTMHSMQEMQPGCFVQFMAPQFKLPRFHRKKTGEIMMSMTGNP